MTFRRTLARRRLLGSCASLGAVYGLAGCLDGGGGSGDDGEPDGGSGSDSDAETDGDSGGDDGSNGEDDSGGDGIIDNLDLEEANVVDVAFEESDGTYTVDVTLHHDDDGEEGYANWWQVERLDGTQIARRELLHAHSNQPFTRSETMAIPDGVECVVVRGHDQTHGYGGVAMAVSLPSGALTAVDQGSEKQSLDAPDCP